MRAESSTRYQILRVGTRGGRVVEIVEKPCRQDDLLGAGPFAPADFVGVLGVGLVAIDGGQHLFQRCQALDSHQGVAEGSAVPESSGIPTRVFAERQHGRSFGLKPLHQEVRVLDHHVGDLAKGRTGLDLSAGKGICQVAEEPGSTQAPPSDDHTVASGLFHHAESVLGLPDVPITEHRNGPDQVLELGNSSPPSGAVVELGRGAGVQGDRGTALLLGDLTGVPEVSRSSSMPILNLMVTGMSSALEIAALTMFLSK